MEDTTSIKDLETNKISFEAYHKPGLSAGKYTLEASLDFSISSSVTQETFQASTLQFEVSGPRFSLSPSEVQAVFPPRDSQGEFDNVFPHIEINRSTLPWERSAGKEDIPWLCLILLQEDELSDKEKVGIQTMPWCDKDTGLRDVLGLEPEVSDEPDDKTKPFPPVKVLKLKQDFLKAIFPTVEDLTWLTHVRVGHDQHGEKFERAMLVCNRMPRAGSKAEVHLVSLEGRLDGAGSFNLTKRIDGKIPLLSLLSWQFTCPDTEEFKVSDKAIARLPKELKDVVAGKFATEEDKDLLYRGKETFKNSLKEKVIVTLNQSDEDNKILSQLLSACHIQTETFKGLMDALDMGWLNIKTESKPFFQAGSIPVAHGLRQGSKTVSWYRGPFVATPDLIKDFSLALPARNADQLLLYDATTKMLDTSYASAWELGRLLTIGQPRISQQIAQWKISHAREAGLARQSLAFTHIPFTDAGFVHKKDGQLDQNLQNYFEDLSLLKGVPFQYLVQHEKLLPHESLRFFHLDDLWVEALLDGAFSIGRNTKIDTKRIAKGTGPHENERPVLTGILLRSDLVSGWPSLLVEGYKGDGNELLKEDKLAIKRFERVGPAVLLVLFEGVLTQLTIHLPAESLHFGFSRPVHEGDVYFKELKSLDDGKEIMDGVQNVTNEIKWRPDGNKSLRVFDPVTFVDFMKEKVPISSGNSGQLAVELLEGVPRLIVKIKDAV